MMTNICCAECGMKGGISHKACKSCMLVKYCNADCQRNHWPKHKKQCKQRAAELRDEALFTDPPPKEDCPICFLPMPVKLFCCMSLPPATILSVPIFGFAKLPTLDMEQYYPCCGKIICKGCIYSTNLMMRLLLLRGGCGGMIKQMNELGSYIRTLYVKTMPKPKKSLTTFAFGAERHHGLLQPLRLKSGD
jgi:hypothetical protein